MLHQVRSDASKAHGFFVAGAHAMSLAATREMLCIYQGSAHNGEPPISPVIHISCGACPMSQVS